VATGSHADSHRRAQQDDREEGQCFHRGRYRHARPLRRAGCATHEPMAAEPCTSVGGTAGGHRFEAARASPATGGSSSGPRQMMRRGSCPADLRGAQPTVCGMNAWDGRYVRPWRELARERKSPAFAGLFPCAEEDSNLHGPFSPQGPQPCASTNSATGAGACGRAAGWLSIAALDSVDGSRYCANTCSFHRPSKQARSRQAWT
jgi:hypothetical protein